MTDEEICSKCGKPIKKEGEPVKEGVEYCTCPQEAAPTEQPAQESTETATQ
ncbi:MAG: hypothetical protein ABIG30_02385 [Candidatus Aenigmatarchaeota archaeon]